MLFCGSQTQQWECDYSLRQCRQPQNRVVTEYLLGDINADDVEQFRYAGHEQWEHKGFLQRVIFTTWLINRVKLLLSYTSSTVKPFHSHAASLLHILESAQVLQARTLHVVQPIVPNTAHINWKSSECCQYCVKKLQPKTWL